MSKLSLAAATLGLMLPLVTLAQIQPIPTPIQSFQGLIDLMNRIANIIFTILMVVAVIFILMAAFNYLTAMGSNEKVGTAHRMILYSAVAIAVALLSKALPLVVRSIVGA